MNGLPINPWRHRENVLPLAGDSMIGTANLFVMMPNGENHSEYPDAICTKVADGKTFVACAFFPSVNAETTQKRLSVCFAEIL